MDSGNEEILVDRDEKCGCEEARKHRPGMD